MFVVRLVLDGGFREGRRIFGDDSPGSPLIVCKAIQANQRSVGIRCLFADVRPAHRRALELALEKEIASGLTEKPLPDCATALTKALAHHPNSTIFFYLDPYGIKDLEFERWLPFIKSALATRTPVSRN